jgi:hypothetical protein
MYRAWISVGEQVRHRRACMTSLSAASRRCIILLRHEFIGTGSQTLFFPLSCQQFPIGCSR